MSRTSRGNGGGCGDGLAANSGADAGLAVDGLAIDAAVGVAVGARESVGAGLGAAVTGLRPVVEIMYVDFMGIAMDQLNNQVAKIRYMFGGKIKSHPV